MDLQLVKIKKQLCAITEDRDLRFLAGKTYFYQARNGLNGEPESIEVSVVVDYCFSLITDSPFGLNECGYMSLKENDIEYCNETVSLSYYMSHIPELKAKYCLDDPIKFTLEDICKVYCNLIHVKEDEEITVHFYERKDATDITSDLVMVATGSIMKISDDEFEILRTHSTSKVKYYRMDDIFDSFEITKNWINVYRDSTSK